MKLTKKILRQADGNHDMSFATEIHVNLKSLTKALDFKTLGSCHPNLDIMKFNTTH